MGQVLFAEIPRAGERCWASNCARPRYAVYGLLLPSLALMLAAAPLVLRPFGQAYAADATGCLRVLALSALPAGGTYLIDSILIARDRTAAYTFMQISNAALILGGVGLLPPYGLTAAPAGLPAGQVFSLVLGLLVVAMGRSGRHRPGVSAALAGARPSPGRSTRGSRTRAARSRFAGHVADGAECADHGSSQLGLPVGIRSSVWPSYGRITRLPTGRQLGTGRATSRSAVVVPAD